MPDINVLHQDKKVNTIFSDNAHKIFENGYNIIPLRPCTKVPLITNWQAWCENEQSSFQIDQWCAQYPDSNIGIPLGSHNKLIAIDFDNDMGGMREKIETLLEGSPVKKQGNKGYTAFYQYNGEIPRKWGKDGKMIVELLSTGNQTVIPPSIHPDTKQPYTWLTNDNLFNMTAADLPVLPPHFITEVDKLFGRDVQKIKQRDEQYNHELPSLREIEKALSYIPSMEYATWITMGMALKHNYNDSGFEIWDAWSRRAPNYDSKGMAYKWSSFGNYKGNFVTIGSLIDMAISYGYIPSFFIDIDPDTFIITVDEPVVQDVGVQGEPVAVEAVQEPVASPTIPQELLDNIPGLPGEIAAWIDTVSRRKQPILSLAAALAATGTIYNQRVVSSFSGERPNIYTIGISPTGAGKDSARVCIDTLFAACNLDEFIFGDPTSDTGLFNVLDSTDGIGFIPMDELGRKLQNFMKSKGSMDGKLLDAIMQLFSTSNGTFRGKEFANRRDNPRVTIHYPSLSIYGTTTRKSLYDALTSDSAIDGFLNRWLIFETPQSRPPKRRGLNVDIPPQGLIDNIMWIKDNVQPEYEIGVLNALPKAQVIQVTEGAAKILEEFDEYCDARANKHIDDPRGDMWVRSAEIAGKIALICHPYKERQIESSTAKWACQLVKYLTEHTIDSIIKNVSDNEHEKNMKRIMTTIHRYFITNAAPIRHDMLCHNTNFVKRRDRNDLLAQLAESGMIQIIDGETSKGNKTRYYQPCK